MSEEASLTDKIDILITVIFAALDSVIMENISTYQRATRNHQYEVAKD